MSINPHICTDSDCPNQICTAQTAFRPVRVHGQVSKKKPPANAGGFLFWRLAVTYSHTGTPALPSAIHRFTAEFGMGSGGSNALLPPGKLFEALAPKTSRILNPGSLHAGREFLPDSGIRWNDRRKSCNCASPHRKQAKGSLPTSENSVKKLCLAK